AADVMRFADLPRAEIDRPAEANADRLRARLLLFHLSDGGFDLFANPRRPVTRLDAPAPSAHDPAPPVARDDLQFRSADFDTDEHSLPILAEARGESIGVA